MLVRRGFGTGMVLMEEDGLWLLEWIFWCVLEDSSWAPGTTGSPTVGALVLYLVGMVRDERLLVRSLRVWRLGLVVGHGAG